MEPRIARVGKEVNPAKLRIALNARLGSWETVRCGPEADPAKHYNYYFFRLTEVIRARIVFDIFLNCFGTTSET